MASKTLGVLTAALALMTSVGAAEAAQCGNSGAGFDAWKKQFAAEARAQGVGPAGIAALMRSNYSTGTIRADRGQKSFKLSLSAFMAKRGSATIVARGRALKRSNSALFASIQQRYGVPPGPLLAIWGMETGFGNTTGSQNTVSAVATLAYDCRRPAYFTDHLIAALKLVDRGGLSASTIGAMHGEVGHTQFLPKNILQYALASTARFLKGHGWVAGAGYQPGEPNFAAIQGWNAAEVYQKAIAIMGRQIDGG